jgi:hypothetical protein
VEGGKNAKSKHVPISKYLHTTHQSPKKESFTFLSSFSHLSNQETSQEAD